jgi:hypothetical protein
MNKYKNDLWALTKKDINLLKSELNFKRITVHDYFHFGENARKLSITLS